MNSVTIRNTKAHSHPGESNPRAILTAAIVEEARKLYQPYSREYGTRALAKRFGVSQPAMQAAIEGRTWRHPPRPDSQALNIFTGPVQRGGLGDASL